MAHIWVWYGFDMAHYQPYQTHILHILPLYCLWYGKDTYFVKIHTIPICGNDMGYGNDMGALIIAVWYGNCMGAWISPIPIPYLWERYVFRQNLYYSHIWERYETTGPYQSHTPLYTLIIFIIAMEKKTIDYLINPWHLFIINPNLSFSTQNHSFFLQE